MKRPPLRLADLKRPWLRVKVCDFIPERFVSSQIACYHPWHRTIWIIHQLPRAQFIWTMIHEIGHWLMDLAGAHDRHHDRYDRLWETWDPYPVNSKTRGSQNPSNISPRR